MNSLICASFGSIMMNVLYVVIAIVVLLTMVLIHELGHYIVGRKLGFKITEFSIGFGKAIWQKRNKRGELISFRIFPLGGYCAFLGETDNEESESDRKSDKEKKESKLQQSENVVENKESTEEKNEQKPQEPVYQYNEKGRIIYDEKEGRFNNMRPWKRILVYFAGVTFNFLSAFLFSIVFLCVGAYDGYKISPSENYVVNYYSVTTGEQIGTLQKDTLVYAINGTEINYAQGKVFDKLVADDATEIKLTINVGGAREDILIKKAEYPVEKENGEIENQQLFGINYSTVNISYGFDDVLRDFIPFTFNLAFMVLEAFWWIISGQIALNQLGGPISTISQMTMVASYGVANFLYLLPLLAANLAIFNILPIPGLDGAHVIFTSIEWARGKPINRNVENAIHGWGILLLFAFVIIIDVVHLITA